MKNKNACVDFDDLLKEKLKDPKFKKGYERAGKILKIENHFNDLLQTMGIKDMFVEVKDMSEY
jgi:hypothetical protein